MDPLHSLKGWSKERERGREWVGLTCPWSGGAEAGERSPHPGQSVGTEGGIWGCWRVKKLICGSLNGVRTTQTSTPQSCISWIGWQVHWCPGWLGIGIVWVGEQSQDEDCFWLSGNGLTGQMEEVCGGQYLGRKVGLTYMALLLSNSHGMEQLL